MTGLGRPQTRSETFFWRILDSCNYQEEDGVGEEERVVLNMLADLAQDTVVILGKEK